MAHNRKNNAMTKAKTDDKDFDIPFEEVLLKAYRVLEANPEARLYQKFTCIRCLSRQMMETPNRFYRTGRCEECGHITNIEQNGCGFLAHFSAGHESSTP